MIAVGRCDWSDVRESQSTLGMIEGLLDFCESHVRHENDFVHTAMEARRPGSTAKVGDDHRGHIEAIAALRRYSAALEEAQGMARPAAAAELYMELTLFLAENYAHMHYEETRNNEVLWSAYSDAELLEIHRRLVASLSPEEGMLSMRWMLPNANAQERAGLLGEMREVAPAPAFDAVLGMLRSQLSSGDWNKLGDALGLHQPVAVAA
jgi:hypothetical protein